MADGVVLRRAVPADRDFLIEAIVEAERGGAERISYCEIFSLTEGELRSLLAAILEEDFEGQELCISGFLVAEVDGVQAGAACAWIEGESDLPSTLIKANLLHHFLDAGKLERARPWFDRLEALAIARESGAAQLESIYVRPPHRGRGITGRMLDAQLSQLCARAAGVTKSQIILVQENDSAWRAYQKLGFRVAAERRSDDPMLRAIVPGGVKLLMEKTLSDSR